MKIQWRPVEIILLVSRCLGCSSCQSVFTWPVVHVEGRGLNVEFSAALSPHCTALHSAWTKQCRLKWRWVMVAFALADRGTWIVISFFNFLILWIIVLLILPRLLNYNVIFSRHYCDYWNLACLPNGRMRMFAPPWTPGAGTCWFIIRSGKVLSKPHVLISCRYNFISCKKVL